MGLGDWLSDAVSGLGSLAKSVATTIGREATDFTGALVGGTYGALTGKGFEQPTLAGISTVPEALGGYLGTAIGGGVGKAIVERAVAAGPLGTSGVEERPTTLPQGGVTDLIKSWGITGIAPEAVKMKATALPGGAPVQAGFGDILDIALQGAEAVYNWGGMIPQIGQALGLAEQGGEQMANGGALVGPGAAPGTIYRVVNQRLVPRRSFSILNPSTGRFDWFKSAGRPILWSGDFAACKRVDRVARRARRARGKR